MIHKTKRLIEADNKAEDANELKPGYAYVELEDGEEWRDLTLDGVMQWWRVQSNDSPVVRVGSYG